MWFLDDQSRLATERSAIDNLNELNDWLNGVAWNLTDEGLCVDVIICIDNKEYPLQMFYPTHFPAIPPIVRPRDTDTHWSSHQYNNGVLCLEWGPDTWHPKVTGAQMLESAYRLLDLERPLSTTDNVIAPSRHHLVLGQELRGKLGRFYIAQTLEDRFKSLRQNNSGKFKFSLSFRKQTCLLLVHEAELAGNVFVDNALPEGIQASPVYDGHLFQTSLEAESVTSCRTGNDIFDLLHAKGDVPESEALFEEPFSGIIILDESAQFHCFLCSRNKDNLVTAFPLVHVKDKKSDEIRLPENHKNLSNKTVGIVGLGSVGSKIAISLARTGIKHFFLVDYDVFLPANMCRHALDWREICEHKVDAIKRKLTYLAPGAKVEVRRLHLTGQESNAALNETLTKISNCDVIIDATASPSVFNLLADVSTKAGVPLVWMEVYAGGIGGMIARSRPKIDPDPYTMRRAYLAATSDNEDPNISTISDYVAQNDEDQVMIATDADVGIISGYAIRLTLDTLLNDEESDFPYSMYMIGLCQSWMFKAPLHAIPIRTAHLVSEQDTTPVPGITQETAQFVKSLLNK